MKDNLDMKLSLLKRPSWSIRMASWNLNQFRTINLGSWLSVAKNKLDCFAI